MSRVLVIFPNVKPIYPQALEWASRRCNGVRKGGRLALAVICATHIKPFDPTSQSGQNFLRLYSLGAAQRRH